MKLNGEEKYEEKQTYFNIFRNEERTLLVISYNALVVYKVPYSIIRSDLKFK